MARPFAPYEQTITFRVYPRGNAMQEGHFTSVTIGPRSYRDEYDYGDFQLRVVVNGDMIADVGNRAVAPLEVRKLTTLNPIYHVSFDSSDVIRGIQDASVAGRPALDVMLHGTIGPDGRIHDPMINRSGRDDLNDEALKIFSTWTFTPAACNGQSVEIPADITLHFRNR